MDGIGTTLSTAIGAAALAVEGRVQGVGFRPFVRRLARVHGLAGWVRNNGGRVTIRIEGPEVALAAFSMDLIDRPPPLARPRLVAVHRVDCEGLREFSIVASTEGERTAALIPPDHFACADCLAEMRDPMARRYRYPFINCTQCGPRYTIIDRLPYDRLNTSMAGFVLCPACRSEYDNPDDRRYHAQPLGCPRCGPRLELRDFATPGAADGSAPRGEAALAAAVRSLREGRIVAVKGIGGFHLLCDARSEPAVRRLRLRKRRPDKPLAVMVRSLGTDGLSEVRAIATPCVAAQGALIDPVRPIVLVPKREDAELAPNIAPRLNEVGVLLPYSPLHALLLDDFGGPVVATSGNRSGDPVEMDETSAMTGLAEVADVFLVHDRPIRRPADDPVFRVIGDRARPLRLGRGNAPLQLRLPGAIERPTLAVGGQMRSTVALAWDDQVVVSPHIGDLGSPRAQHVFSQAAADLQELFGIRAQAVVCDQHPDFSSTRWARRMGLPVLPVSHHHAHASALAGEHHRYAPLLVFTWDGVGLGEDGTLWGGEALLGGPGQWRRVASLRPFRLPGGERVVREPWRSALGLCWEAGAHWPAAPSRNDLLRCAWERRLNAPTTSSAGRLFDAAAALVGLVESASYEGQGPMLLEAAATDGPALELPLSPCGELIIADWAPLLAHLLDASQSIGRRSATFHGSLAGAIHDQAILIRKQSGVTAVGLTGGVFQNRRLTERAMTLLEKSGFDVLLADTVPPNDAGLSFGQLVEAAARQGGPSHA